MRLSLRYLLIDQKFTRRVRFNIKRVYMIFYKGALSKAGLLITMLDRREAGGQVGIILFSSATHLNAELALVLHSFTPSASPFLTRA